MLVGSDTVYRKRLAEMRTYSASPRFFVGTYKQIQVYLFKIGHDLYKQIAVYPS
jgi:hypothetical protein